MNFYVAPRQLAGDAEWMDLVSRSEHDVSDDYVSRRAYLLGSPFIFACFAYSAIFRFR